MADSIFGGARDLLRIPNLPTLFADETLYSWAGSVHLLNPTPDVLETSRRLYSAPYAALMHDFPSHLDALCRNVDGTLGEPTALALRHTLLGYFLTARPRYESDRILRAVESGPVSSLKFWLGIAASRVGGRHPLKGCPHCFDEQRAKLGRAYWRVSHQLPSVLCCVEHEEMLEMAWDEVTPVHRRGWLLPRGGLETAWRKYPSIGETLFQRLRQLADFSSHWAAQRTLHTSYT